ncbi:hypothetical protein Pfo_010044 [Paulownia fortunei]|nr:hypothetical protein Pfo_010044 [Paulownia fortunei]
MAITLVTEHHSTNLNTLLYSLSSNMDINGFYSASEGQNSDRANAIALCRGDIQLDSCRNCQAILWTEFCMLRYSSESIHGTLSTLPGIIWRNTENVTNPERFEENLRTLLDKLRGEAAYGGPLRKVAAGNGTAPRFQTIYAMVQCTPDLSSEDCSNCLIKSADELIPGCCDGARGVRILTPNCNIRFELYPFFNSTTLQERLVLPSKVVDGVNMINMAESLRYDFGIIRAATNDFSDANKLGQGGFGAVYMGKLLNGQEIAVKRLSKDSKQGDLEFANEVLLVAKLQHRNLERLLIYEFLQNASLDRFIFDSTKRSYFDWDTRYKVLGGIARGLLYLHEDSWVRVIHRDLKASNVLLDGEMNPKISDFGMARLFVPDETQGNTNRIVGTYGYMAPEYVMHGQFSIKSDVFSFGVLILEIISGQKNNTLQHGENVKGLLSFAWRNWRDGTAVSMIDAVMRARSDSLRDIVGCIHIGLLCVQENASDRPTMAAVVSMLNSLSLTLPLPSHPAFFVPGSINADASVLQGHHSKELETIKSLKNDASISELYPR